MPTVRKLQFANGVVITEPTDLTLEAATNQLPVYIDDAAYDADNDVTEGSIYLNTTLKAPRMYIGGVWRTGIMQNNATDATKQVVLDTDGALTGVTHTLDFNGTASRVYTFPDTTATVVVTLGAQELEEKTIKNGFLDGTKIRNGALDVEAAGALTIGATVGANNLTLGGSGSTVQIPGNLTVSGTTTTVNTDTLDVEDKNITVNKGGNDALSEGAGLTVDRTGTKGSIIYKDLAPNKFAAGALGSEKNLAAIDDITATNFSGTLPTSKGGTGQNSTATFPTSGTVATTADITAANFSGILASSNGGTGVNNAGSLTYGANNVTLTTSAATSVTLPTSGTLATLAGSEQLSNKTLVEPVLDNFIDINEEAAPVAPGAGKIRVYAKADGKLYKKDDTGAESEVGSGGAGTGRNYLQDFYDATKVVSVSATTLAPTANRASDRDLWARSTVAGLTVENNAVSPLRQAGDYLINSSASTIASFVETPCFSIDNADLGLPLSVEFDLTGVAASTSYDVVVVRYNSAGTYQETIVVAGTASAGSPASAQLPTGTGKFKGFFIPSATSTDLYAIRLRKVAAVDDDFQIDSLFVGPGSSIQGAIVTAWEAYTPTYASGTITGTTLSGFWRRTGNTLETKIRIQGSAASSLSASTTSINYLPTGLTVDSTKLATRPSDRGWTSTGMCFGSFDNLVYNPCMLEIENPATTARVLVLKTSNASPFAATNFTALSSANFASTALNAVDRFMEFHLSVPISQWAGSGTTTLANRAVEEYAYNTSTSASNDTSSFGYGLDGVLFPNISAFGTSYSKRVRFQTSILPTDNIFLEYLLSGAGAWRNASQIFPLIKQGASSYGIQLTNVTGSTTDVEVQFRAQGSSPSNATYGGNGDAWSTFFGDGTKWRLRKVSSGAAVGYPVSARNIVGDTTGTAVPAGYVGQIVQSTISISTNLTSNSWTTITSATLSSGIWLVTGSIKFAKSGASQTFANIAAAIGTSNSDISTNYTSKYEFRSAAQISTEGNTVNSNTINFSEFGAAIQPFYVRSDGTNLYFGDGTTLGTTQNLTLAVYCLTFTGGPATAKGKIEAVRIA